MYFDWTGDIAHAAWRTHAHPYARLTDDIVGNSVDVIVDVDSVVTLNGDGSTTRWYPV